MLLNEVQNGNPRYFISGRVILVIFLIFLSINDTFSLGPLRVFIEVLGGTHMRDPFFEHKSTSGSYGHDRRSNFGISKIITRVEVLKLVAKQLPHFILIILI